MDDELDKLIDQIKASFGVLDNDSQLAVLGSLEKLVNKLHEKITAKEYEKGEDL